MFKCNSQKPNKSGIVFVFEPCGEKRVSGWVAEQASAAVRDSSFLNCPQLKNNKMRIALCYLEVFDENPVESLANILR